MPLVEKQYLDSDTSTKETFKLCKLLWHQNYESYAETWKRAILPRVRNTTRSKSTEFLPDRCTNVIFLLKLLMEIYRLRKKDFIGV